MSTGNGISCPMVVLLIFLSLISSSFARKIENDVVEDIIIIEDDVIENDDISRGIEGVELIEMDPMDNDARGPLRMLRRILRRYTFQPGVFVKRVIAALVIPGTIAGLIAGTVVSSFAGIGAGAVAGGLAGGGVGGVAGIITRGEPVKNTKHDKKPLSKSGKENSDENFVTKRNHKLYLFLVETYRKPGIIGPRKKRRRKRY